MNDTKLSFLTFIFHIDCTISNFTNDTALFDFNFDTVGMELTYPDETQIIVPCFFKMKCTTGQWTKVFGGKCEGTFIFVFKYIFMEGWKDQNKIYKYLYN